MNVSIIWLAKNNVNKCITEASIISSFNIVLLNVSLFILDRQNSNTHSPKVFIANDLFYFYKSSYTDSIFSDFCDVINFSNANYILPVPDDDPIEYKQLLKMLENFGRRKNPDKAIYIPVPSKPLDISSKINYGTLESNSTYTFWQYMHNRTTNIAFYSLLSSNHTLKAYSMLNKLTFEKYWLNPLWDQFFVWLLSYTDLHPNIHCIDEFYLHYNNANWSDKTSIKETRLSYRSSINNIEASLIYLFLSIRIKIRLIEYMRWSFYLLKKSIIYYNSRLLLELFFKLIRLNFINLFRNPDETYS